MAGKKKDSYFIDKLRLLSYGIVGLSLLLFYTQITQILGSFITFLVVVAFFVWTGFTLVKTSFVKKIRKKPAINKAVQRIKSVVSSIPTVVWGGFAVLGIFFFGLFIGLAFTDDTSIPVPKEQTQQVENYKDVISAYKNVSKLYFLQGQDMDIITDMSKWDQYPDEVFQAIASYKQKKDEIIFEYGRLYEVMRRAKVPTDPFLKTE